MNNTSFLPEDYLAQRAERRTNVISLTLFAVVMSGVFMAFLVTNRKWAQVKTAQESMNAQYQDAAVKIEQFNQLQSQKEQMLTKASLAETLVERVPRSILLAELINRMPARLSVLKFEMKSEELKRAKVPEPAKKATGRVSGPTRAKTKEEVAEETKQKVEAPKYMVTMSMVGVAPTDVEVSRYMSELNAYPLLSDVGLEYSKETEIEGQVMREFRIRMALSQEADVKSISPLVKPRVPKNPMTDKVEMTPVVGVTTPNPRGSQ